MFIRFLYSSFLLTLTALAPGFSQQGEDIDLGGESVATSIIPVRTDTAQAFRFDWLDLAFRDLVVSHPDQFSGSSVSIVEFTDYSRLEAYEFLIDKAAFYRYFMHQVYQASWQDSTSEDTSVTPSSLPAGLPNYPIVQKKIQAGSAGGSGRPNPRFVPLVTRNVSTADSVYRKKIGETIALSELYQLAVTYPNPIERIAGKKYHFKHEYYYHEKSEALRAMTYDIYALLNEELLSMYDDPSIETDTTIPPQNRCLMATKREVERPLFICEKELMAYAKALQQQALKENAIEVLTNTSIKLKTHFEGSVRKMENVATTYQSLQENRNPDERQLFDWIIAKTQPFYQSYYTIQQQLQDYLKRPQESTSYWHLMTFAEYLRVLESITLDEEGLLDAVKLYNKLSESYHKEVWELEANFLQLQQDH